MMKRGKHPEYDLYEAHRAAAARYRQEMDEAQRAFAVPLLQPVRRFFATYNRVLWQQFPYCRRCLGGCCVVGATDLKPVDYIALAALDETLPKRPARSPVSERACIYLTPQGCSWPAAWRPLKCAAFYCLGSGAAELDASDARYLELTAALQPLVDAHLGALLPAADRRALREALPDPVAFADLLAEMAGRLLAERVAIPEGAAGDERARSAPESDVVGELMTFVGTAAAHVMAGGNDDSAVAGQLLDDLETLEWIALGRPARGAAMLATLHERYSQPLPAASPLAPLRREMADRAAALREQLYEPTP